MKARRKPVEHEIFKYDGDGLNVLEWSGSVSPNTPTPLNIRLHPTETGLYIKTLEGEMHVSIGDIIICGVNGEFWPVKPDIFEKTYEVLNEESFN